MVVLRSTTPEVAVSSLSRSNLLTVISIADPDVRDSVVSDCVSTPRPGMRVGAPLRVLACLYTDCSYFHIQKTSVNTGAVTVSCGKVDIFTQTLHHARSTPTAI